MRHCLTDEGPQMDSTRRLDDVGRRQAKVMRKFMKLAEVNPDVIISSDFPRALETAQEVRRGDTPLVIDARLQPDSTPAKAWKAILAAASKAEKKQDEEDGQVSVLVVTHGPLIQQLLADVAFCFQNEKWPYHHGAVSYINTAESAFRWYVNPKLAAHLVGTNPKKVENPVGESLETEFAQQTLRLAEHLLRAEKAAVIDPLVGAYRDALRDRWARQRVRCVKAIKKQGGNLLVDYGMIKQFAQLAIAGPDEKFQKTARAIRLKAYKAGARFALSQLAVAKEAKRPPALPALPGPDDGYLQATDAGVDDTSVARIGTAIDAATAASMSLGALVQAVQREFNSWTDAPADQVPRSETVALDSVSQAYHGGSRDYVTDWRGGNGPVEKSWDCEPDACDDCQMNADAGFIDSEAPFDTGDFEPPAHPNCRCSLSYQATPEQ